MTRARQSLGRWGERVAEEYLRQCGYTILERNARTPHGELDLVACQETPVAPGQHEIELVTVFVEVKTRTTKSFGHPEESVTARKQAHLLAAAQYYLQTHADLEGVWRIDVISIERYDPRGEPAIHHFENAVH
jgi:putative endonuclease